MKIFTLVKILTCTFILLVIPASCQKEKVAIAKKNDYTTEIKRLTIIGDNYLSNSDYKNAYITYNKILSICDPVKNRVDYVETLISLGFVHLNQGDPIQIEATATKILPHLKYLKKTRFAYNTYNLLGMSYLGTKDYDAAILYFKKAYNLDVKEWRKLSALCNIALVHMQQKDYGKAIKIYEKLTTEGHYVENQKTNTLENFELKDFAIMLDNLGICYFQTKNSKSIKYFNEALKLRIKTNDLDNLTLSYSNLSDYYLKTNLSMAKKYAEKGYKIACSINNFQGKKYTLYSLIQSSQGNDLKKYSNLYVQFYDSIAKIRLKEKNLFSNIKYNFIKDKKENLELTAEKVEHEVEMQRQKNRSYISYVIIFISILSLIFITFYTTKKGKRDKANEVFRNEKRISEKLQFELEKDIDKILLFTENSNLEKEENKEQFLSHLSNIYSKTRNISRENSEIFTDENFERALKEMISVYATPNLNILINGLNAFSWSKIDRIKKITAFRVIQEIFDQTKIMSNLSLASITFKKEEKNILIMYADNRTGIRDAFKLNKRFINSENRLKSIKGSLNISLNPNQGFKVFIKIPI